MLKATQKKRDCTYIKFAHKFFIASSGGRWPAQLQLRPEFTARSNLRAEALQLISPCGEIRLSVRIRCAYNIRGDGALE